MSTFEQIMKKPFFRNLVGMWAAHLRSGNNPALLANLLLETMMDTTPEEGSARRSCSMFVNMMACRDWPQMLDELRPYLRDILPDAAPFEGKDAEAFYTRFKGIIVSAINDYYDNYSGTSEGAPVPEPDL